MLLYPYSFQASVLVYVTVWLFIQVPGRHKDRLFTVLSPEQAQPARGGHFESVPVF